MAAAAGQAAGMAVGAAVGSVVGQPVAGAAVGSSVAGGLQQKSAGKTQEILDEAALRLNQQQARTNAAEKQAIHARNFRQSLASQIALASFRGGGGSVARQFGTEAIRNFLDDQKAIEAGVELADVQGQFERANLSAKQSARDLNIITNAAKTGFEGLNLNLLNKKE